MQKDFEWTKSFYSSREDVKNINIIPAIAYILSGLFFTTALVFLIGGGAALINRAQSIVLMLVFFPMTAFAFLVGKLAQKIKPDVITFNSNKYIIMYNIKEDDYTKIRDLLGMKKAA